MEPVLHTYNYLLKDGKTKMYGYRFEIASVENKRKWVDKRGFRTKAEAVRAGNDALGHYNNTGETTQQSDISFADFLDYWIEHDCKVDLSQNTVSNYEKKVKLYIKPYLGKYRLRDIKKDNLQDLLVLLYDEGFSPNTITVIKGILTKSFNFAVDRHYIRYSPAVRLKTPKNREPKTPSNCKPHIYIPKERMDEIFERFPEGSPSYIPMMFGYRCGLRLGEAYAILWEDIDLNSKTLTVNRQVQWRQDDSRTPEEKQRDNGKAVSGDGYWYFKKPKYNSTRTISLDNGMIELLLREKERQEAYKKEYDEYYYHYYLDESNIINTDGRGKPIYFVNVRESGEYITPRTFQHTSRIIHSKLNFPEFDFHSLRHTHATMLYENGAPLKYIQNRLGHRNIDMTLDVYTHHTETIDTQGYIILNNMY